MNIKSVIPLPIYLTKYYLLINNQLGMRYIFFWIIVKTKIKYYSLDDSLNNRVKYTNVALIGTLWYTGQNWPPPKCCLSNPEPTHTHYSLYPHAFVLYYWIIIIYAAYAIESALYIRLRRYSIYNKAVPNRTVQDCY